MLVGRACASIPSTARSCEPMDQLEIEGLIKDLNTRTKRIEQILPSLATKEDLADLRNDVKAGATKDDLKACATKDDLKACATKDDLKACATKDDLKACATKDDLKACATKDDIKAF